MSSCCAESLPLSKHPKLAVRVYGISLIVTFPALKQLLQPPARTLWEWRQGAPEGSYLWLWTCWDQTSLQPVPLPPACALRFLPSRDQFNLCPFLLLTSAPLSYCYYVPKAFRNSEPVTYPLQPHQQGLWYAWAPMHKFEPFRASSLTKESS